MPRKPVDVVTGRYAPFIDKKTGKQKIDPEKGLKWRITATLPRRGNQKERPRMYRDVYGSEYKAKLATKEFVAELNVKLNHNSVSKKVAIRESKVTFGEYLELWLEANKHMGLKRRTWETYVGYAHNHLNSRDFIPMPAAPLQATGRARAAFLSSRRDGFACRDARTAQ